MTALRKFFTTAVASSLAATILLLPSGAPAQQPTPDRWTPLFNGRNLDGWTVKIRHHPPGENFADTFRVEDGLLKVRYDAYDTFDERFGHIFYNRPFSHYVLRVEYRFVGEQAPAGPAWARRNSGIMLHGESPDQMTLDQDFPASIEVQLLGGLGSAPRTTANLCTPYTHVVMDDQLIERHCTNSTSETYHGDQWVTVEVEVRGNDVIRHTIDGRTVLEYNQPQLDLSEPHARRLADAAATPMLSEGTISLQSESHPVDFRSIEIKLLDAD